MVIMGHNSFNPDVRSGMLEAAWADNPHVHLVEIDFVHGSIYERSDPPLQMWSGLFLALLLPDKRNAELVLSQRHELLFRTALQSSAHVKRSLAARAFGKVGRLAGWGVPR